jgi:hypothetical protein
MVSPSSFAAAGSSGGAAQAASASEAAGRSLARPKSRTDLAEHLLLVVGVRSNSVLRRAVG